MLALVTEDRTKILLGERADPVPQVSQSELVVVGQREFVCAHAAWLPAETPSKRTARAETTAAQPNGMIVSNGC
ncbi:hypothetical protein C8D87_12011 [Lentzea atacamensis]|uniref:Uncharacterized protein n=1 Tax=Lentzea atacamensis TaxID=531938 RepID=A0ABX9DXG8_9PSEU|nr:hypothetical protein C8D87_12011 [Lentzea atacamensis]